MDAADLQTALAQLLERGARARATVRAADGPVPVDDWSSQRGIVYDQAVVNRWKTDCLRLLREAYGTEAGPYVEFGALVERAGVLWRAIDPGMALLERLHSEVRA